ncbi:Asp-tRNA(Asn)/Glu-tRNA(Gln) amidotransferase subunit GatB, partial [bacterium]|nr:Asp-tRNA(Asn)/Glu-tRNA(Gln) amidotransferase subunit GatB [bacterium]
MKYELLVGLEIHAQAQTRTKMYCRCAVPTLESEPNTLTCPTCLGLPGALPVPNAAALALAERASRLFGATVLPASLPERKNYSYPDLPKGYQISQFSAPFAASGSLSYFLDGEERTARIVRLQVEEDTAKLIPKGEAAALDFNRSGVPLLEIVTAPDFTDARAVGEFLRTLRAALRENGICDGRMETGSMRCEPNVSLTADGVRGQKVEIKNVGSIRAVERAVAWEARHQEESLRAGGAVRAVTKGWDERRGECVVQRDKESAADYRYFPEPDLPPIIIDPTWVNDIEKSLPELPEARKARFMEQFGLPLYDANLLTAYRPTAEYFEKVLNAKDLEDEAQNRFAKSVSNWISGE